MAAFEKIESGYPALDGLLDHIRLGDNVVWQVSKLEEFNEFAQVFANQAMKEKRTLVYVRFAQHKPFFEEQEGLEIVSYNPDEGFEAFTVAIHQLIEEKGKDAFYVFDSLSELQSVWYTDLMMGNFFAVTCPFLFQLDTVAYFPLIRGRHSFDTIAKIRETTQLLLDVCSQGEHLYLHPLKVWNRYSDRMFMPYVAQWKKGDFMPLSSGVAMSQYYQLLEEMEEESQDQNIDSYDRFFAMAKLNYQQGIFDEKTQDKIIDSTMTKDPKLKELIQQFFGPKDYFAIRNRMIGSGAIGGKACGILLARRILKTKLPEYGMISEPHDSFYIGSDVFYSYIVHNKSWDLRIRQRTKEGFFSQAGALQQALLTGEFPANIRQQFEKLLEYFGQYPMIVRSSSFLEDGFGNAFAGKYESVFCPNQGDPKQRLEEFQQAIRTVYASTMDESALAYRRQRGLEEKDEQMAILVQRVSGSYYGDYFCPAAAGVGFSRSVYKWRPDMDVTAGMLRLVVGLGTKAVDRTREDYPRLVNLDAPATTTLTTDADKHKYSQRNIDVIDCKENVVKEISLEQFLEQMPYWYKRLVLEQDYEAQDRLRQMGRYQEVWYASCQKLLEKKEFTSYMQQMLKTLEEVYGNPVDIEYTVTADETGAFRVNLLQCRPLFTGSGATKLALPDLEKEDIFFELKDSAMGESTMTQIQGIVWISPKEYYEFVHGRKREVAEVVGRINHYYKEKGKKILLMTPGRIGTSSPELGVAVSFAQICNFYGICEVADLQYGHMPELSYGSHMFQDLVEAKIQYAAILNNQKTISYQKEWIATQNNLLTKILPEDAEFEDMIRVIEVEDQGMYYMVDAWNNHVICGRKREKPEK